MNFTAEQVMNAYNDIEAAWMTECAAPGHETQCEAILRDHWGLVLCTCCIEGHHDARGPVTLRGY